ncbi:MAG: hypothetical protein RLZZ367_423 [Bacteroidota bacterium]
MQKRRAYFANKGFEKYTYVFKPFNINKRHTQQGGQAAKKQTCYRLQVIVFRPAGQRFAYIAVLQVVYKQNTYSAHTAQREPTQVKKPFLIG